MKKIKIIFVIFFTLLVAGLFIRSVWVNNVARIIGRLPPQKHIDTMVLAIEYLGCLPFGKAEMKQSAIEDFEGKPAYHINAEAKPSSLVNAFYKVRAEAESYIDREELHSLKFMHRLTVDGEVKENKVIRYDQANHIMEREGEKRIILPDTYDPLSVIFYLTQKDLALQKTIDLNINTNQKNYRFYARVTEKKEIKTKEGKVWELYLIKGNIKRREEEDTRHSSSFAIWFLNKPFKAPLMVKVFSNAGPITVRLVRVN